MKQLLALLVGTGLIVGFARPAAALEALPITAAVSQFQQIRQYLAPLDACQTDILYEKVHASIKAADATTSVTSIINALGLPSDANAHTLAMVVLALATHIVDKEKADRRAIVQPLERAANAALASVTISGANLDAGAATLPPGTCAGLSPTVIAGPEDATIAQDNYGFQTRRKAIAAFLKAGMAARLATIAATLQNDGSLITPKTVIAAVQSHLGDVQDTEAQLAMIEYVAIQEALDGRLPARGGSALQAQVARQQSIAYWYALRDLQKGMSTQYDIVGSLSLN